MKKILILHGPNLNLLGTREPDVYGSKTLAEINNQLIEFGRTLGLEIQARQSNHEGELIDILHEAASWAVGVVFNPGGYSHTSVALRDAVAALSFPVVEVHLSNVYAREPFRHESMITPVCVGKIAGFGWHSYQLGIYALLPLVLKTVQI